MSERLSDFDLLDLWALGRRDAGDALYERHFPSLFRFFRHKLEESVPDLIQRTFLGCLEGSERFRRESSFRTYLFRTARHQLYLHYRELKRNPRVDFSVTTAADMRTSASDLVARKQAGRWLLQGLSQIALDHQIVIELSFWEDMSGAEIAQVLGVPEGTVRARRRRAMIALRAQLQELGLTDVTLRETGDDLSRWAERVREMMRSELDTALYE